MNSDLTAFGRLRDGPIHEPSPAGAVQDLFLVRAVAHDLRLRPDQRQPAGDDAGEGVALIGALEVVGPQFVNAAQVLIQALPLPLEFRLGGLPAVQRLDRYGKRAVPIFVERRGQFSHQRSGYEYVIVGVLGVGIDLKIGVADIAAADERGRVVGDEQFIVHPVIKPFRIE